MGLLQVWSEGQCLATAVALFPYCLAEREGARAGHALGLPSSGVRIWGKGLLHFMIPVTLAGGPVRVPERTESQSISSRFLLQVLTPPLRYSPHSSSHSATRSSSSPDLPVFPVGPVTPGAACSPPLSKASQIQQYFALPSFGTIDLAGFMPALLS